MFSAPSEKTVMFLNAPLRQKTAALSGLSDEPAGPAAGEEFCRGRRGRTETDTETETGSL